MSTNGARPSWSVGALTDLGTVARGRSRHRPRNDPSLFGGSYPFFQTGDVKAADLRLTNYHETYNDMGLAQSRLWPKGTLCITIAANIADAAILGIPGCFPDSVVGFTPNPEVSDVVFVKYLLDHIKRRFESISRGTTQDNLSLDKLLSVVVTYPDLRTQRKIAAILSTYDDLIENNHRRIKLLEEMAQRIYREWFVDFRYPGHENASVVGTTLGPIPAGWAWKQLRELAEESRTGVDPSTVDPWTPYVGLEHMPERSIAIAEWGVASEAGSRKYRFRAGDVLFGKIRPYFHKVAVPPIEGICSTDAIVLRSRAPFTGLVIAVVSSEAFVQEAVQTSQGTKMPRANWSVLERHLVAVPPSPLIGSFDTFMGDSVAVIHRWVMSNRNLRATRDLLLPRLISGEMDVADLDIAMAKEDAA